MYQIKLASNKKRTQDSDKVLYCTNDLTEARAMLSVMTSKHKKAVYMSLDQPEIKEVYAACPVVELHVLPPVEMPDNWEQEQDAITEKMVRLNQEGYYRSQYH